MAIKNSDVLRARARLTRQGQISVPKAVRERLGLEPGDELEFHVSDEGAIVTRHEARSILDFAGVAAHAADRIPQTAEEIDRMIAEAAFAKRRTRRR